MYSYLFVFESCNSVAFSLHNFLKFYLLLDDEEFHW